MAFTPQGFTPDPEHVVAATITPDNPHVSAAALAQANRYAKPHTEADDNAPALEPGQKPPLRAAAPAPVAAPPTAAAAPVAPFMPAGFKPDAPPQQPPRMSPQDVPAFPNEAADLEQQQREAQTGQGLKGAGLAYSVAGGEMLGGALASAATAFRASRAAQAASGMPYGVAGSVGGRFSMERLGNILAEDADKVTKAVTNGNKIPPFQEWGRVAETLSDNPKTASALTTLWSDPKYKIVRWAILSALSGSAAGGGMARYMAHRALYDAVVP